MTLPLIAIMLMTQPAEPIEMLGGYPIKCSAEESRISVSQYTEEETEERRFDDGQVYERLIRDGYVGPGDISIHASGVAGSDGVPDDIQLLAQIVHAESRGEPYEGKKAVADVVLNRVDSDQFPDTIREVIYEPGQFQPVSNGTIHNTPSEDSLRAAREALEHREDDGSLFFYNPRIASDGWIFSRETVKEIGQHRFAR